MAFFSLLRLFVLLSLPTNPIDYRFYLPETVRGDSGAVVWEEVCGRTVLWDTFVGEVCHGFREGFSEECEESRVLMVPWTLINSPWAELVSRNQYELTHCVALSIWYCWIESSQPSQCTRKHGET